MTNQITPCLWFDNQAEDAADQHKNYFIFPHQLANGEERLI